MDVCMQCQVALFLCCLVLNAVCDGLLIAWLCRKAFQLSPIPPPPHLTFFVRFLAHQVKDGSVELPANCTVEHFTAGTSAIAEACANNVGKMGSAR